LMGAAGGAKQASYPEGASAAGYREAWNKIAARLEEPPPEVYSFASANPHLLGQAASLDPTASRYTTSSADATASASQQAASDLAADDGRVAALLDKGMELFALGAVSEATLVFEAAAQAQPDNDTAWRMLGRCHAESDEDKRAILCLQRAVECDPYSLPALLALGTSYVNELDSVRALETLKAWVKHNPEFAGFQAQADAYSDGTLMDEVTQLMLAAADHSPASADVHVLLGVLYNISLDYDQAVVHLRQALALGERAWTSSDGRDPNHYTTLNKLGATLANAGRAAEALPLYAAALAQRPTFARGWLNLGISFANLNKYSESAKAYVQALHLSPGARHIWGYLRVVLTCLDRLDLVERCGVAGTAGGVAEREAVASLARALDLDLISEPGRGPGEGRPDA